MKVDIYPTPISDQSNFLYKDCHVVVLVIFGINFLPPLFKKRCHASQSESAKNKSTHNSMQQRHKSRLEATRVATKNSAKCQQSLQCSPYMVNLLSKQYMLRAKSTVLVRLTRCRYPRAGDVPALSVPEGRACKRLRKPP